MSGGYRYIEFNEEEEKYLLDKLLRELKYSDIVLKNKYDIRLHANGRYTIGIYKDDVMIFLFEQQKYIGNKTEGFFGQKKTYRYQFAIWIYFDGKKNTNSRERNHQYFFFQDEDPDDEFEELVRTIPKNLIKSILGVMHIFHKRKFKKLKSEKDMNNLLESTNFGTWKYN